MFAFDKRKLKDDTVQRHCEKTGASNQQAGVASRKTDEGKKDQGDARLRYPYERVARSRCLLLELVRRIAKTQNKEARKHDCRAKSLVEKCCFE